MTSRTQRAKPKPVMNVTPLVDVVLVLLIIFMVVIPAMDEKVRLSLPSLREVDANRADTSERASYTVAITSSGSLYLDSVPVAAGDLERLLRGAHRAAPAKRLILRGDEGLSYGAVRRVFALAQQIGFPGVLLRVNERRDG